MTKYNLYRLSGITLALALCIVYAGLPITQAQSCPVAGTFNGSIAAGDSTQTGRLARNALASDCNGKTFPGLQDSNLGRRFDQFSFTNTNTAPICVQVTLDPMSCGASPNQIFSAAYLGSYNPANISQNYLGDLGSSPPANTPGSYSIAVPAGATFVVVVHEITANGGCGAYNINLSCTAFPPPRPTAAKQVLISEFRLSGPGSGATLDQRDEFIELYNNTDGPLSIGGFSLQGFDPDPDIGDFILDIPAGSVIPARGHFLVGDNGGYSLATYAALDLDTLPEFDGDFFIDNQGFQLINSDGTLVLDSVGFVGGGGDVTYIEGTGLRPRTTTPPVQYSYVRKMTGGTPQDTDNNADDFALVSVDATTFAGPGGTIQSILGAPGPENTTSPIQRNARFKASLLDPSKRSFDIPNRQRFGTPVANGAFGTLRIRRTFRNTTGRSINTLRFRVVDITTLGSPGGGDGSGQADLRVVSSPAADFNVTVGNSSVPVKGTQVESPAPLTQSLGGGLNSSLITITTATPILDNATVSVEFNLGVQGEGNFRVAVNAELDLAAPTVALPAKAGKSNTGSVPSSKAQN